MLSIREKLVSMAKGPENQMSSIKVWKLQINPSYHYNLLPKTVIQRNSLGLSHVRHS